MTQEENSAIWGDRTRRSQKARELIVKGIMQGYLVYADGRVAGWCNAGDKTGYGPIMDNSEFETRKIGKGEIRMSGRRAIPMWKDTLLRTGNWSTNTMVLYPSMKSAVFRWSQKETDSASCRRNCRNRMQAMDTGI